MARALPGGSYIPRAGAGGAASHTSRGDVDARAAAALLAAPAAFSQITRCTNCTLAYARALPEYRNACHWDARADAASFTVPCCTTPRERFDWMGVSVRTASWRLTRWCAWNGTTLNPRWQGCEAARDELFDHRADRSLFDVDSFDNKNVADLPSLLSALRPGDALMPRSTSLTFLHIPLHTCTNTTCVWTQILIIV